VIAYSACAQAEDCHRIAQRESAHAGAELIDETHRLIAGDERQRKFSMTP